METSIYRIAELVVRHIQGNLTDDERQELENWITASKTNRQSFEYFRDHHFLEKKLIEDCLCNKKEAYHKFVRHREKEGRRRLTKCIIY